MVTPPTANDETAPDLDGLIADVEALKRFIIDAQQHSILFNGEHVRNAFLALDQAWFHLNKALPK